MAVRGRIGMEFNVVVLRILLKRSRVLRSESSDLGWASQWRNNARRRAGCRICTAGMSD